MKSRDKEQSSGARVHSTNVREPIASTGDRQPKDTELMRGSASEANPDHNIYGLRRTDLFATDTSYLNGWEEAHKAGNKLSLLYCVIYCHNMEIRVPSWAVSQLAVAFHAYLRGMPLDRALFGKDPKGGRHSDTRTAAKADVKRRFLYASVIMAERRGCKKMDRFNKALDFLDYTEHPVNLESLQKIYHMEKRKDKEFWQVCSDPATNLLMLPESPFRLDVRRRKFWHTLMEVEYRAHEFFGDVNNVSEELIKDAATELKRLHLVITDDRS